MTATSAAASSDFWTAAPTMATTVDCSHDVRLQTISGLLRAAFAELPYNLATAAADRNRWLHSRRSKLAVADVQSAPAWRELTQGIPATTAGYKDHAVHYRRFLSTVSAALGGEAPPDEVASTAALAFKALSSVPRAEETPTDPTGREALQRARAALGAAGSSAFGSGGPPEDQLRVMLGCHTPLASWLRQHRASKAPAVHAAVTGAQHAAAGLPDALGSHVVDEFVAAAEAAEAAEAAAEAGPAAHDAIRSYSAQAASSESRAGGDGSGGGGDDESDIELGSTAWLREQCALHLRGDGGSASEVDVDTLAATLLEPLIDSPKSDEALQGDLLDMLGFSAFDLIGAAPDPNPHRSPLTSHLSPSP